MSSRCLLQRDACVVVEQSLPMFVSNCEVVEQFVSSYEVVKHRHFRAQMRSSNTQAPLDQSLRP